MAWFVKMGSSSQRTKSSGQSVYERVPRRAQLRWQTRTLTCASTGLKGWTCAQVISVGASFSGLPSYGCLHMLTLLNCSWLARARVEGTLYQVYPYGSGQRGAPRGVSGRRHAVV